MLVCPGGNLLELILYYYYYYYTLKYSCFCSNTLQNDKFCLMHDDVPVRVVVGRTGVSSDEKEGTNMEE